MSASRLLALLSLVCPLSLAAAPVLKEIPLSSLDLTKVEEGWKTPVAGLTEAGNPIRIAGRYFARGFGTWAGSRLEIRLDGDAERLSAFVGVTDDTKEPGPVWFEIVGDDRMLAQTPPMRRGDEARAVSVSLAGVKDLVLVVHCPDTVYTCTAWAGGLISYTGVEPVAVARTPEAEYILTPPPGPKPRFTGARIFGARPHHPFLFTVTATGDWPMRFAASGLPAGLALDPSSGRITGAAAAAGDYHVAVTAGNVAGAATEDLEIVIGSRLALTPAMGWNSWNCFGPAVNAEDVREAADAMVREGLANHGWTYVNVDDYWSTRPVAGDPILKDLAARARAQGQTYALRPNPDLLLVGPARDGRGRINANLRFPDMAGLAAYIHARGLKAGLYSSPSSLTCGQCIGSYGHEAEDAAEFASWGFDYLKYDWCTYGYLAANAGLAEAEKPYILMGRLLAAQPRDIVFSLCQYGKHDVWTWGAAAGGNSWRVTSDVDDSWGMMSSIGFSQSDHEAYAGPGHWTDPDMLVVGWVGLGHDLHRTRLSPDEQYTHLSLWSLLAAPLLIGCDLNRLDDFTRSLLTNDEVLAVDQDPLGRGAHRISRDHDVEVWARPLADGSMAVGLFNRGELPATATALWSKLGIPSPRRVRDLWRQKDLGVFADRFSALIPRHGVILVRLIPD